MTQAVKIGVVGLGTVGKGVLDILDRNGALVAARGGRPILVSAVSARDRCKDRGLDLTAVRWFEDAPALAADPEVDVVLELIGGSEGVAREVVETALRAGKPVVTANKALIAHHGTELAQLAQANSVPLAYEAAVAGGIPVIKALREGLAANRVERIQGILNGTCNYILTTMRESGREFAEVLADAQRLGYAEADPAFDIDGVDAAHKLAILTALAFGCEVDFEGVHVEGIRSISATDIEYAEELGYRIKLLGIAQLREEGVEQRVHPCMVPKGMPLAHVEGVFNAVHAIGDFVGSIMVEGRGAGAGPTASAVVADLVDIARGVHIPAFTLPAGSLVRLPTRAMEGHVGAYYVRLMVVDRPGVIAEVTAALRDSDISVESFLQRGRAPGEAVPVILTTHETKESAMQTALSKISNLEATLEEPRVIRIETS